jgi:ATP-dependent Clp protease ATP-binding subunit ClpA
MGFILPSKDVFLLWERIGEEAIQRNADIVTSEDWLLALVRQQDNRIEFLLESFSVSPDVIEAAIQQNRHLTEEKWSDKELQQHRKAAIKGGLAEPIILESPAMERVWRKAYDELWRLKSDSLRYEHIMLGLVAVREGIAGRILAEFGFELKQARQIVRNLQGDILLRPSVGTDKLDQILLRPAKGAGETDPQQLLRPAETEEDAG